MSVPMVMSLHFSWYSLFRNWMFLSHATWTWCSGVYRVVCRVQSIHRTVVKHYLRKIDRLIIVDLQYREMEARRVRPAKSSTHEEYEPRRVRTTKSSNHEEYEPRRVRTRRVRTAKSLNREEFEPRRVRTTKCSNHEEFVQRRVRTRRVRTANIEYHTLFYISRFKKFFFGNS